MLLKNTEASVARCDIENLDAINSYRQVTLSVYFIDRKAQSLTHGIHSLFR